MVGVGLVVVGLDVVIGKWAVMVANHPNPINNNTLTAMDGRVVGGLVPFLPLMMKKKRME